MNVYVITLHVMKLSCSLVNVAKPANSTSYKYCLQIKNHGPIDNSNNGTSTSNVDSDRSKEVRASQSDDDKSGSKSLSIPDIEKLNLNSKKPHEIKSGNYLI